MSLGTSSNAIHTYASSLLPTAKIRRISETTIKRKKISVKRFRNTRKRLNLPNYSARIAVCQRVSRNILRHHAATTDDTIIPDGYAWHDAHLRPYPNVIPDGDRFGILQASSSLLHIERMPCGIKSTVGSHEYIVAKLHLGSIQYHAVHIAIEVLSYLNVIAIVAIERLLYQKLLARLAQEFPQYLPSPLQVGRLHQIIFVADVLAHLSFLYQFPVLVGIIQHAPSTFFLLCHHCHRMSRHSCLCISRNSYNLGISPMDKNKKMRPFHTLSRFFS